MYSSSTHGHENINRKSEIELCSKHIGFIFFLHINASFIVILFSCDEEIPIVEYL